MFATEVTRVIVNESSAAVAHEEHDMEIVILPTPEEVGRMAAARIAFIVTNKPSAVIGLATGSSPQDIYAELKRRVDAAEISFA